MIISIYLTYLCLKKHFLMTFSLYQLPVFYPQGDRLRASSSKINNMV